MGSIFHQIVPCCQGEGVDCICGDDERVLRAYAYGGYNDEPMTPEQREWCLEDADRAGEGSYPREEAEGLSDAELAKWTINAWNAYVRSNI